ncbi:aldo/keto reductase family oxidoreductase [Pseudoruegeria sp. SK021]|uniref:aldo/keto reductase n=1 Tax=Pseudoruegeria sp. SK021 TaxID=1933035 RepID=UPI000A24BCD3|nr:aldo/keto reductase [Pseudoruegeria sp. SK021]OSP56835.1 oxidoreductase [Pseudoruegeria sp. SK021]
MPRVTLAPGLDLSRLVYGMWRLADDPDTSPDHVQAKIEACLSQGITSFDQADIYGGYTAEAILGRALKAAPHLRDQMQIVTKCGIKAAAGRHAATRIKHYDTSRRHIMASVESSLTDMAIEQIDVLLIHRPDPFLDPDDTGAALDALVTSDKVRHVGASNFAPHDWQLLQSRMSNPLITNQIEISLLASSPFRNGEIAFLHERRIPPMAWSPLAGGALFSPDHGLLSQRLSQIAAAQGVAASAVAIAWLLAHPAQILPVLGTNNLDRIARIGEACQVSLDRETWFDLYSLALGREVP